MNKVLLGLALSLAVFTAQTYGKSDTKEDTKASSKSRIVLELDGGENIDESISAANDGFVEIEHSDGDVLIKGWKKNEVRVVGELGEMSRQFTLQRRGNRVNIEVEVRRPKGWGWNQGGRGDQIEIFVPVQSRIDYSSINANVEANGIYGGSRIETVNGKINAEDLKGKIQLESVNGSIRSENLVTNKLNIETVNGDIRDTNSKGERTEYESVNGDITADSNSTDVASETVNGSIELELESVNELSLSTVNGSIEAELDLLKNGNVRASTVGGSIELAFPQDVSARFDIEGHAGGNIKNRLTDDKMKKAKYGPSRWLRFSNNGGEGSVDISTVSGRITIDKK